MVDGKVTKIVAFGAFVEIYAGIEGLVHISELANRHIERPDEVVSVGQEVQVKIIEVDSQRRRLSLSIKRVDGDGVKPLRPLAEETGEDEAEVEAVEAAEVTEAEDGAPREDETAAETTSDDTGASAAEPAPAADEPGWDEDETPAETATADEPVLGLSDDVFPNGKAADDAPAEAVASPGDDEPETE